MKSFFIFVLLIGLSHPASAQIMTLYGQMHHTRLEGGCWYLQTDDGKHYELIGDTSIIMPLRVDGERVGIQAERVKGGASICMVGEIVRVIKQVSSTRHAYDPPIMPFAADGRVHHAKNGYWYLKTSDGKQYEFQKPPANKYRHSGVRFHQIVRLLIDKSYTHNKNMEGEILPDGPPQPNEKNIPKKYDPR